jgi:hypothetical protein
MEHQDIATELVQHGASVREGQSAIQRNWDSIQYAQENVRAAQTLLGLIEQANNRRVTAVSEQVVHPLIAA